MEWSRLANDDVRRVAQGFEATPKEAYSFWCECGCRERLTVRLRKFDALRLEGQPLLLQGHGHGAPSRRSPRHARRI